MVEYKSCWIKTKIRSTGRLIQQFYKLSRDRILCPRRRHYSNHIIPLSIHSSVNIFHFVVPSISHTYIWGYWKKIGINVRMWSTYICLNKRNSVFVNMLDKELCYSLCLSLSSKYPSTKPSCPPKIPSGTCLTCSDISCLSLWNLFSIHVVV